MFKLTTGHTYSGTIGYDGVSPILLTESGERWRLRDADALLFCDEVVITANELPGKTLRVTRVLGASEPVWPI